MPVPDRDPNKRTPAKDELMNQFIPSGDATPEASVNVHRDAANVLRVADETTQSCGRMIHCSYYLPSLADNYTTSARSFRSTPLNVGFPLSIPRHRTPIKFPVVTRMKNSSTSIPENGNKLQAI